MCLLCLKAGTKHRSLTGCINVVTVEKFTGHREAVSLFVCLAPNILVIPRADGGMDVQTLMLEDAENEYVVRTFSFLSAYKNDYTFERLGGQVKTGQWWTEQIRPVRASPQARVLYRVPLSSSKS